MTNPADLNDLAEPAPLPMAYDVAGPDDGPLVVLLHAGVADRRMWEPQWAALAEGCRVVRPDLRGYGETPMPGGRFSHVEDVAALVRAMDAGPAALVGSSFGGKVALATAVAHPELVSRLVLLCPAWPGVADETPDVEAFDEREDELLEAGDVDGAVRLNVETWLGPDATPSAAALVADMQRRAFEVQLAAHELPEPPELTWPDLDASRAAQPTVIISGGQDLAWFGLVAQRLAETMPNARHVTLPWASHLPTLERPADTTPLLLAALRE